MIHLMISACDHKFKSVSEQKCFSFVSDFLQKLFWSRLWSDSKTTHPKTFLITLISQQKRENWYMIESICVFSIFDYKWEKLPQIVENESIICIFWEFLTFAHKRVRVSQQNFLSCPGFFANTFLGILQSRWRSDRKLTNPKTCIIVHKTDIKRQDDATICTFWRSSHLTTNEWESQSRKFLNLSQIFLQNFSWRSRGAGCGRAENHKSSNVCYYPEIGVKSSETSS